MYQLPKLATLLKPETVLGRVLPEPCFPASFVVNNIFEVIKEHII